MQKLVVLKLDGDLFEGVRVNLDIGLEGGRAVAGVQGSLPPNLEMVASYEQWRSTYRSLENFRISPISISIGSDRSEQINKCLKLEKELSKKMNSWLNCESFRLTKEKLLKKLMHDDAVRVLIKTDDIWLRRLPWQLWDFLDDYSEAEVALSAPEYENLNLPSFETKNVKDKVKVLAILGNSEGISIEEDRKLLDQLPNAETTFLVEPKRSQLSKSLWEQDWDILFFAGHSFSHEDGKTGIIYINKTDKLTIDDLRHALKRAVKNGLQLAIFNSCDGLGLAYQLEDLHIGQIVVMREPVPDRVAQEFLKNFLTKFSAGEPFYLAVRESRERLHDIEEECPCAVWLPVICQNQAALPPTWQELRDRTERNSTQDKSSNSYPSASIATSKEDARSRSHHQTLLNWRSLRIAFLASVIITGLIINSRWQGKLQAWELQAFDHLMQLRPVAGPDRRLLVVRVTAADIQAQPPEERGGGAASLSDRTLEKLLANLEQHQPRVIGLDIYREGSVNLTYPDLAANLQGNDRLITVCKGSSPSNDSGILAPPDVPQNRVGFSDLVLDEDDVIRRHLLLMELEPPYTCKAKEVEAFSLKLVLNYLKTKGIFRQDGPQDEFLQIGNVVFKPLELHTGGYHRSDLDRNGNPITDMRGYQLMLNYLPYRNYLEDIAPTVTLKAVLNNQLALEDVRDRIVLIGVDDDERDQHSTPYTYVHQPPQKIPGVFIHAQMVNQLLRAVLDRQPLFWTWHPWVDAFWVWGWSLVGGVLAWRLLPLRGRLMRSLLLLGIAGGAALGILYIACFSFLTQGGWIPLIPAALALLATVGSVTLYTLFQGRRH